MGGSANIYAAHGRVLGERFLEIVRFWKLETRPKAHSDSFHEIRVKVLQEVSSHPVANAGCGRGLSKELIFGDPKSGMSFGSQDRIFSE